MIADRAQAAVSTRRRVRPGVKVAGAAVRDTLGYVFKDDRILETALTHVSALKSSEARALSYQRLEFLGDHVLGLVVSDMLFRGFPDAAEGELSQRLAELVRRETCADVATAMGLIDAIKLGTTGGGAGARLRESVAGDICEAVIGAIYLDGGYSEAAAFIARNWTARMHKPARPLRDSKTVLQEWAQGRGLPIPTYRHVARSGPDHQPQFRVAVVLPGYDAAEGEGLSKRTAEQAAASAMLAREGVAFEEQTS